MSNNDLDIHDGDGERILSLYKYDGSFCVSVIGECAVMERELNLTQAIQLKNYLSEWITEQTTKNITDVVGKGVIHQ